MTTKNTNGGSVIKYRSIAYWPKDVGINLGNCDNRSEDTHDSFRAAEAVCNALHNVGFDGEGRIFPIKTEVVPYLEKKKG